MPEIKDKHLNTNVGRGAKAKAKAKKTFAAIFKIKKESSALFSDEQGLIDVKLLSHSQHVELRKSALTFYLNNLYDVLYGTKSMEDPINIVQTVYAIYATLHNSYVHFHWNETDWRFQEIVDVSSFSIICAYVLCAYDCIYLNYCRQCTSFSHLQLQTS